jgi:thiosulfate/3-mercaptopyruvate sulfurtransferase
MTTDKPDRERTEYPVVERDDAPIRAFIQDAVAQSEASKPLIDVRSPEEFRGERMHMPDYPNEGALRGGHIPGRRTCRGSGPPTTTGRSSPPTSCGRSTNPRSA